VITTVADYASRREVQTVGILGGPDRAMNVQSGTKVDRCGRSIYKTSWMASRDRDKGPARGRPRRKGRTGLAASSRHVSSISTAPSVECSRPLRGSNPRSRVSARRSQGDASADTGSSLEDSTRDALVGGRREGRLHRFS